MPEASNKKYTIGFLAKTIAISIKKAFIYLIGAKFIAGIVFASSLISWGFSAFIMDINDIGRWISYNKISNSEKVERAFQNKESFQKFKSELNEHIATLNIKIEEQKNTIEKNKEKTSALETKLAKVENQNKALNKQAKDNNINQVEKENNALKSEIKSAPAVKSGGKQSEQILTIPLGEIIISKGKPKIMLNGKASFTTTFMSFSSCTIKIFSLFGKSENIQFEIDNSSPTIFILNKQEYIMHYIDRRDHTCKIEIYKT